MSEAKDYFELPLQVGDLVIYVAQRELPKYVMANIKEICEDHIKLDDGSEVFSEAVVNINGD